MTKTTTILEGNAQACGQCGLGFKTETAYLRHVCEVTGVIPTEPASMGANWEAIQKAALERGAKE